MIQVERPAPPGTVKRRFRPKFHYELFVCGARGHELVGTDAAEVRAVDADFVRDGGDLRWYRCLRCDSWLPLQPPRRPRRQYPPERAEIALPLRGKALRDMIVLRLIALNRSFHFVVLGLLATLIFVFAEHRRQLRRLVDRLEAAFYGTPAGHVHHAHGLLHDLERLVTVHSTTLWLIGLGATAYALLEGAEAVGLWFQRRWAEYLTFVATTLFLPLELYELAQRVTVVRSLALVINLAIVLYLLLAKRLFGLRGGAVADRAARERDSGWEAFHRLTPGSLSPLDDRRD